MEAVSGLAFIEVRDSHNPLTLFNEWISEGKEHGLSTIYMNLATSTKTGHVSNRTVVVRDVLPDGNLVILTNPYGKKAQQIAENPQVASTIFLKYSKGDKNIDRQIRIEGKAEKLSVEQCRRYYDREPIYCKIRGWLCNQGEKVDWNDLKAKHDELLKDVLENKNKLEMPEDNMVAYKIVPKEIDFYYAFNNYIGDRVLFTKESGAWKYDHVQA